MTLGLRPRVVSVNLDHILTLTEPLNALLVPWEHTLDLPNLAVNAAHAAHSHRNALRVASSVCKALLPRMKVVRNVKPARLVLSTLLTTLTASVCKVLLPRMKVVRNVKPARLVLSTLLTTLTANARRAPTWTPQARASRACLVAIALFLAFPSLILSR